MTSYGLSNVSVSFGTVLALDGVTLHPAAGEVTVVAGGDGAGKTTLLRVLAGLTAATSGIARSPGPDDLGYLPTGAGSWRNLSVDENVEFVGGAHGLTGPDLTVRARPLLEGAGLSGFGDRLAGQLSGGMRTKLGFCLAMLHSPGLVVLDEPTTGVDPTSRVDLWRMITEAASDGAAIVLSSSYMDDAERGSTVALLDRGRVVAFDSPDAVTAAMPGDVVDCDHPTHPERAWRTGTGFREWWPGGAPAGTVRAAVTLEDASIVAALSERETAEVP